MPVGHKAKPPSSDIVNPDKKTAKGKGKLERYHRTIKGDCIRPGTPLSLEDARRRYLPRATQNSSRRAGNGCRNGLFLQGGS